MTRKRYAAEQVIHATTKGPVSSVADDAQTHLSLDKTRLDLLPKDATPSDDRFALRTAVPKTQSLAWAETTVRMANPKSTVRFIDQTANNYR